MRSLSMGKGKPEHFDNNPIQSEDNGESSNLSALTGARVFCARTCLPTLTERCGQTKKKRI
jgi:hypothetical protein